MPSSQPVITLCCSAHFYRQALEVQAQLCQLGYAALVPEVALRMQQSGDFEVSHYKTWFGQPDDYFKKAQFIRDHFAEVNKADAILVLNYTKHGIPNYIGGNVLMEMGLAFWLKKPIYILHELPETSPFLEEIKGLLPIVLQGRLEGLAAGRTMAPQA